MIGTQGQTVHFVDGKQLCTQQYAEYRYIQGRRDGQGWLVEKIRRFHNSADNDKAFRALVLTYLGLDK